jgi:hypothetical protein
MPGFAWHSKFLVFSRFIKDLSAQGEVRSLLDNVIIEANVARLSQFSALSQCSMAERVRCASLSFGAPVAFRYI